MFDILKTQKLLAAVTFPDAIHAIPVAEAFLEAGLTIMEIPLRTEHALNAISQITKKFPEITIGAGTILTKDQLKASIDAGAKFGLAPALNTGLLNFAASKNWPFIPGVLTPTEIETAALSGFTTMKLFPAEQVGGIGFLKAINGPYAHLNLQLIPMGGVDKRNLLEYLKAPNVIAVGGSWMASQDTINKGNYYTIRDEVREAVEIVKLHSKN